MIVIRIEKVKHLPEGKVLLTSKLDTETLVSFALPNTKKAILEALETAVEHAYQGGLIDG